MRMMLVMAPEGDTYHHPEPYIYVHKYNAAQEAALAQAAKPGYTKDAILVRRGLVVTLTLTLT